VKVTYVNRRFLDYRVPVLAALDQLLEQRLHVIYSRDAIPERVHKKMQNALGERAIGLRGEWQFGRPGTDRMANQGVVLQHQPGLYAKILETRPDVVIGEGFFKWSIAALACKLIRKIPFVVCYERTAHTERNAQWYRTFYRKLALRQIDAFCCNGSLCADYVMSLGMPRNRITLGHMAADSTGLAENMKKIPGADVEKLLSEWNTVGPVFVYVGQMILRKGIHELLTGWKMFEEQLPGRATLLLVGDGDQKKDLESYRNECGLRHVHFAGAVDYDAIARYYAVADALIIPTLEDNWSLVVPEAMACGLPILCSKYNGCWPELVKPGINGWIFDPHSREDIVNVLKLAVQHQNELGIMGNRSLEIVSGFGPENAARSILDACHIALGKHGGCAKSGS
jgi:glycosyltransferase involved in cell wall biosynthesis